MPDSQWYQECRFEGVIWGGRARQYHCMLIRKLESSADTVPRLVPSTWNTAGRRAARPAMVQRRAGKAVRHWGTSTESDWRAQCAGTLHGPQAFGRHLSSAAAMRWLDAGEVANLSANLHP